MLVLVYSKKIGWLIEGVLPLSLHFALRSRPDVERWFLLASGSVLFVGALMTFLIFAPDLRKKV